MEGISSAAATLEKTFNYQEHLRQKLEKTLFSRCADEDGSFCAAKIVTNLETLLEAAAKTLESDFEDAGSDFIAVPSEEMERCKSFILALSRAKEQLGLSPLSNRDELNAWLDYAIEEAREVQESYEFDDDEIPVGENGEPLCSELYLDELACEVFGNICFEFNGNETYFANHIAATAERIAKQMTDDLNNGIFPNEDIILSFIAVFEEISSHVLTDMIQLEEDEFEELDESDPDYAEKHALLLEAFTDMDKEILTIPGRPGNYGMFMGTLTGPDIRVESMRITAAYSANKVSSMSYEEFKEDTATFLRKAKVMLDEAKTMLDNASLYSRNIDIKLLEMKKAGYKDTIGLTADINTSNSLLSEANVKHSNTLRLYLDAVEGFATWTAKSSAKATYYLFGPPKEAGDAVAAYSDSVAANGLATNAVVKMRDVLTKSEEERKKFETGAGSTSAISKGNYKNFLDALDGVDNSQVRTLAQIAIQRI